MGNLLLLFGKFLVESPSTLYGWFQKIYPLLPILQCNSWNDESILFEKRYLYSHSYNDCSNRSTSFVHCILPYTNDSKNELSLLILENSPFNMMVLLNSHMVFDFLINCKNTTNILSKPIIHKSCIIIFINGTTIFDAIYRNIYFLNTQSLLKKFLMFLTIKLPLILCKKAKLFNLYSLSMIWNISINLYIYK